MMNKLPKYWDKNIHNQNIFCQGTSSFEYWDIWGEKVASYPNRWVPHQCGNKFAKVKSKDRTKTTYTVFQICNDKIH